ncbi:trehalose operon repressor [Staphylococcus lugdunensis]|nr:trehalose operon repressor [Staphylococcus lugdunensis]
MNQVTIKKFTKIYNQLKTAILHGSYTKGSQLPSEHELMNINKASRETVRKALDLLVADGMIQKIRGKGSVVIYRGVTEFPFSDLISFKEIKEQLGLTHHTEMLLNETCYAHEFPVVKEKLGLRNYERLLHIVRTRSIDGKVKILDEDFFLASQVPSLSREVVEDSIYNYIEQQLNLQISYSCKAITFEAFNDYELSIFGNVEPPYSATVRSIIYLKDTTAFQYNISKHIATDFTFKEFSRRYHNY